jgi:hypothetical protein
MVLRRLGKRYEIYSQLEMDGFEKATAELDWT